MKKSLARMVLFTAIAMTSLNCEIAEDEEDMAELTISSNAGTDVIKVTIRKVDRVENGKVYFDGPDVADDVDYLPRGTSATIDVEPGRYYALIKSMGGFWVTTSDKYMNIKAGEHWRISYTASGGRISH